MGKGVGVEEEDRDGDRMGGGRVKVDVDGLDRDLPDVCRYHNCLSPLHTD